MAQLLAIRRKLTEEAGPFCLKGPHLCAEAALMADAVEEKARNVSEARYRVTELQAALDHLELLELDKEAKETWFGE